MCEGFHPQKKIPTTCVNKIFRIGKLRGVGQAEGSVPLFLARNPPADDDEEEKERFVVETRDPGNPVNGGINDP